MSKDGVEEKVQAWFLNDVCPTLPEQEAGSCALFAPAVIPKAFDWAQQELPQVCSQTGLCDSEAEAAEVQALFGAPTEVGDAACSLCTFVAQQIEIELADNTTQAVIVADADELCGELPESIAATCVEYVDAYASTIIALIEQAAPPEKVCEAIALCSGPNAARVAVAPSNDDCATCEFALSSAKAALASNETRQKVIDKLDILCNQYAGSFAQECEEYVTAYGPDLLVQAAQMIDPQADCIKLGFCGSDSGCSHAPLRREQLLLGKAAAGTLHRPGAAAQA